MIDSEENVKILPIPANFPFEWESPRHAEMSWQNDRLHFAGQYSPLAAWFMRH
jgi:hypothetical protein